MRLCYSGKAVYCRGKTLNASPQKVGVLLHAVLDEVLELLHIPGGPGEATVKKLGFGACGPDCVMPREVFFQTRISI